MDVLNIYRAVTFDIYDKKKKYNINDLLEYMELCGNFHVYSDESRKALREELLSRGKVDDVAHK